MMQRRKKVVALGVVLGAVSMVVIGGVALRRELLEQWYLRELRSPDQDRRKSAAGRLGEVGGARSVPRLSRCLRENAEAYLANLPEMKFREKLQAPVNVSIAEGTTLSECLRIYRDLSGLPIVWMNSSFPEDAKVQRTVVAHGSTVIDVLRNIIRESSVPCSYAVDRRHPVMEMGLAGDVLLPRYEPSWLPPWREIWAAEPLAKFGRPAMPALQEMISDSDPHVRMAAVYTILLMGPDARPAVPALVERLKNDEHPMLKILSAAALGWIGSTEDGVIAALEHAGKDMDAELASRASEALECLKNAALRRRDALPDAADPAGPGG